MPHHDALTQSDLIDAAYSLPLPAVRLAAKKLEPIALMVEESVDERTPPRPRGREDSTSPLASFSGTFPC